ncbi:hypothetical protein [Hirschia baltica]|uniref:hypothetical protein n=1 Tax=Hirschia baltica TaxID=2724 RepID=UPI0003153442|nr:hypothetical protein [Hirschia baltica]
MQLQLLDQVGARGAQLALMPAEASGVFRAGPDPNTGCRRFWQPIGTPRMGYTHSPPQHV